MKRLTLTVMASLALALGAFAQATIVLDNTTATTFNQGVYDLNTSTPYAGNYGLELFETAVPATGEAALLASVNSPASQLAGFNVMNPSDTTTLGPISGGWNLEAIFTGKNNAAAGGYFISLGEVTLPDVSAAGGTVNLGLAVWNTATDLPTAMGASGTHLGVIAFPQATANTTPPAGTPVDISAGWLSLNGGTGQPLIMTTIVPEPGTFALAGLGVAAFLIFRRRR